MSGGVREAAEALLLAMDARALRGHKHVPAMRDEQDARLRLRKALDATPAPPHSLDADVERARTAAIAAMGWTDPRMVEDGKLYLQGRQFASFGFGGECFLTPRQAGALRRCYDGARAALQALGERG